MDELTLVPFVAFLFDEERATLTEQLSRWELADWCPHFRFTVSKRAPQTTPAVPDIAFPISALPLFDARAFG